MRGYLNDRQEKLEVPYYIQNSVLREAKSAKYLGVSINDRLAWNEHVDTMVKKTNYTRTFFQNINRCPHKIKEVTYVSDQLWINAATVWDPASACNIQAVEQVQRRAARFFHQQVCLIDIPAKYLTPLQHQLNRGNQMKYHQPHTQVTAYQQSFFQQPSNCGTCRHCLQTVDKCNKTRPASVSSTSASGRCV